ncbi:HAD hydrolase-like protein [Luteolibacter pohnpeiensis]|uniref:phosphoglycolate phosphatase n=1 Tax=Luteolibacter pohnpeiensis TaxID=454153 RepID=A0A934S7R6_9BACT|nr:HAD hydrolase-like protein [Luteolibacter pohnpeiensis]MBK1883742.1 HAD hydrolase-like protein [Luteolibacter pohnpeiensis]
MFRNLIFDWSGTLVDDLGPVIDATNAVLVRYGLDPMDREQFRRKFRLPYREFYEELLPGIALEELEAHFRPAFDESKAPVWVLPHAREKLDWCKQLGIRTFVLSSMDATVFARQLELFGLTEHFEATYAGVIDKRELIHQILETHHLNPTETAFVGDMTHDIETARHGGISSIAVLTGYQDPEILATVKPDLTVPDLSVLMKLMDRRYPPKRPIITVGGLVHDGAGQVLMIQTHKWGDRWGIPGGKVEHGEPAEQALRREMREETGLEISDIRFALVQDCINSPEFLRPEHFVLLNYTALATSREVVLNEEAEHFRWLPLADAFDLDLNEPTRVLLQDVVDNQRIPLS